MNTMRRIGLLCAAVFFAFSGPVFAATTTTAATSPLDEPIGSDTVVNAWAVSPAGPATDPNQPSERPFLSYRVVPGQVIHDAVTLFNYSNVPLTFRLFAADAFNNEEGAFDVPPSTQKPKEVGAWVRVDQENISLPAKQSATIPITLTVPTKVTPGDHAGAILASSAAIGTGPDGRTVNVDRRTGTRLYVRVAGALNPDLAITQVTNTYRPSLNPLGGKVDLTYRVENQGNVRLGGKHRAEVGGLLGLSGKKNKFVEIPELLPGQGVTLKASFAGQPASILNFAKVTADPDDVSGKTVQTVTRTATTIAIPWTIVAFGIVSALLLRSWRAYGAHAA